MAKVQLISCNPPQMAEGRRIEAAHYRTRQFLDALIERGDEILLCAGGRDEPAPGVVGMSENGVVYRHIPFGQNGWISRLQKSHDEFRPDCIVAVNFSHCLYATRLATRKPLWMDIYGDMVTIQQAYCYRTGSHR